MASLTGSGLSLSNGSISNIINGSTSNYLITGRITPPAGSTSVSSNYTLPSVNIGDSYKYTVSLSASATSTCKVYLPSGGTYLYAKTERGVFAITEDSSYLAPGGTEVGTAFGNTPLYVIYLRVA